MEHCLEVYASHVGRLAWFTLADVRSAQSASTNEREQEMQEMRARIEKLEKLVAELQKKKNQERVATAQAPANRLPLRSGRSFGPA